MNALIEFAGKQYQVVEGSFIKVPRVAGTVGSKIIFDKILYLDDGKMKTIGTPIVNSVKIDGEITSHGRERKVVVFKFKRRKGYQKKNTHRQEYSMLKVGKLGKVTKTPANKKITAKKALPKKTAVKKTVEKKTSPKNPKETKE